jgi:hypothetical protein
MRKRESYQTYDLMSGMGRKRESYQTYDLMSGMEMKIGE